MLCKVQTYFIFNLFYSPNNFVEQERRNTYFDLILWPQGPRGPNPQLCKRKETPWTSLGPGGIWCTNWRLALGPLKAQVKSHLGTKTADTRRASGDTLFRHSDPGTLNIQRVRWQAGTRMCVRPLPLFPCVCRYGRGRAARVLGWGFPSLV